MDREWSPRSRAIAVGTFDDPNWIKPAAHIWTRSALHWMAFPADVQVIETTPQPIDVGRFRSENFPPHVHGDLCPECVALADLSRLAICCEERDLHVLAPVGTRNYSCSASNRSATNKRTCRRGPSPTPINQQGGQGNLSRWLCRLFLTGRRYLSARNSCRWPSVGAAVAEQAAPSARYCTEP
jgi:hypothetical protein